MFCRLDKKRLLMALCLSGWLAMACTGPAVLQESRMEYARWFSVLPDSRVVLCAPNGTVDTLRGPFHRIVCMSSSYVGFLEAIGAESTVVGVSGLQFLGSGNIHAIEAGYDAAINYEAILAARPDLFLTYSVSAVDPPYLSKLRELGIRCATVSEHLESHPLARAEYVKLFGALTGRQAEADSVFRTVCARYDSLKTDGGEKKKVLVNIPYRDQWYIPGGDNYMTRLIGDAGGTVLGAVPSRVESSVISVETAFSYAQEADFWLNPGWCRTKAQLRSVHPLFGDFPVLGKSVWNNTKQSAPGGGNAFWETGPARPDLVLEDLRAIFDGREVPMNYYLEVR